MRKRIAKKIKRIMVHLTLDINDYRKLMKNLRGQSLAAFVRDKITNN
jgi:hypothetical protein